MLILGRLIRIFWIKIKLKIKKCWRAAEGRAMIAPSGGFYSAIFISRAGFVSAVENYENQLPI